MHILPRIARSLILGLIMFFSVRGLGFSPGQASLAAMIPFLLGAVDVMAGSAFSLTGMVFIVSVLAHVFPVQYATFRVLSASLWEQAGGELQNTAAVSGSTSPVTGVPVVISAPIPPPPVLPPFITGATPAPVVAAPPITPPVVASPTPAANPPVVSSSNPSTIGSPLPKQ